MKSSRWAFIVIAFTLVATACSAADETEDSTAPTVGAVESTAATTEATTPPTEATEATEAPVEPDDDMSPMFDAGRCPFSAPGGTDPTCGTVTVPENRDDPDGRQVQLQVAVFPPTSGTDSGVPVVYLEGGPGGEILEAIEFAYEVLFADLNLDRTLVIFDQRGTGYSEPSLACDEVTELAFSLLDTQLETDEIVTAVNEALTPCRDRWAADGIDLTQYNSADSAADVADIRTALGYDEWDLFGVSYGTRLALTVMRDHPEGIRSVILDSTYPPEIDGVASIPRSADRAFNELYAACAADTVCADAYGDVEDLLFANVEALNASPAEILVTDFFTGTRYDALLSGDDLLGMIFQSLYSEETLVEIPELLFDLSEGRYRKAELLVSIDLANQEFLALGQNFSVQCHEEVPYGDPVAVDAAVAEFAHLAPLVDGAFTQSAYAFEFCPTWGAGVGDPIEAEPVTSDIPTLVVAGQFDPITPPQFGADVADRLSNAYFVEYPGLGHGVAMNDGCPRSISLAFLDDPLTAPDTSCVESMPPAAFTVFNSDVSIELVPTSITSLDVVVDAVVPEGWEDVGFGAFYRNPNGTDETAVLIQAFPDEGMASLLLGAYSGQLTEDGELDEVAELTIGERSWRRFSESALGLQIELALWSGDGVTISVILVSDPRQAAGFFDAIFIPVLETVEVTP